jgi:type IV secretory pathway VirB4 component
MAKKHQKKKSTKKPPAQQEPRVKSFLDMVAPTAVKFNTDTAIVGSTYRCTLALRSYPTSTEELALLRHLGDRSGVTLRIYCRKVTPAEENAILHNASNRSRMERSNTDNLKQSVTAEANLQDVVTLITTMQRNQEPLVHCAVFIELRAKDPDSLRILKDEVMAELTRSKLGADSLLLRQREGFLSVNPAGANAFGSQFERVLPATSVGNLFPFNYSGKTDPRGFYIGRDKYGSNILVDLSRRAEDKTSDSVLILGNTGQGKSHLLKLLLCNILESGKSVMAFDPEHELVEMAHNLGGTFVDLMGGTHRINPLEPKLWDVDGEEDKDAPATFNQKTLLSQHISFLRDFFRAYKGFSDLHIDAIELLVERLYDHWGISDTSDFSSLSPTDYPILSDLYDYMEQVYENYDREEKPLFTKEMLQEILLGLHSMCKGAESRFFNGHTNIGDGRFVVFGVKGLLQSSGNVKNAMLFNVLSYFSNQLLTTGNTVATLDELHVWLSNKIAIEYIRNVLKRARKKESSLIMASQNLEDFLLPEVAELTKPLFAIPTHQFLFNAGNVDRKRYMDALQLEESEYELIRYPQRGVCLYKCGNERYFLEVKAPEYKAALFGAAGGR